MSSPARLLFLGTSVFAVPILRQAAASPLLDVSAVVTRPDRPAGRGRRLRPPPVAPEALSAGIPVHQPEKLRGDFRDEVRSMSPDVILSAAYGAYLPGWLLESAPYGVVNVHPSLLPLLRGAAPVARAILEGHCETGVSFMLTDSGWDTGPVLSTYGMRIEPDDTTGSLEERLSLLAASRLEEVLSGYMSGTISPSPQEGEATYAEKVSPEETWLDWLLPADMLALRVRAFQPSPGARTLFRGKILKVVAARAVETECMAGRVSLSPGEGMIIGCGQGSLSLQHVQPQSGRIMTAAEFIRGYRPLEGEECTRA